MSRLGNKLYEMFDEELYEMAVEHQALAQSEAPFVTGHLRESIVVRKNRASNYSIVATAEYASLVHEGHAVRGKKKGDTAEAFSYGESVQVVPPNPFLQRAADAMKS